MLANPVDRNLQIDHGLAWLNLRLHRLAACSLIIFLVFDQDRWLSAMLALTIAIVFACLALDGKADHIEEWQRFFTATVAFAACSVTLIGHMLSFAPISYPALAVWIASASVLYFLPPPLIRPISDKKEKRHD